MVDVVVVNHNSGPMLARCLRSLEQTQRRGGEIASVTVWDNGSKEGWDQLPSLDLPIFFRSGKNIGYGAACNAGAELGRAPYLLFLNPDVEIPPAGISVPLELMKNEQRAGMLGISLLNPDGSVQPSRMRFPTAKQLIARSLGLLRLFPDRFNAYYEKKQLESGWAQWVLGAYLMIRRQAFEAVGGFDRNFFLYFEEIDLAKRMEQRGWRCLYCAKIHGLHTGGGSEQVSAFCVREHVRSRILYGKRYFSDKEARKLWLCALFLEPLARMVQAFLQGSNPFSAFAAPIAGTVSALKGAGKQT